MKRNLIAGLSAFAFVIATRSASGQSANSVCTSPATNQIVATVRVMARLTAQHVTSNCDYRFGDILCEITSNGSTIPGLSAYIPLQRCSVDTGWVLALEHHFTANESFPNLGVRGAVQNRWNGGVVQTTGIANLPSVPPGQYRIYTVHLSGQLWDAGNGHHADPASGDFYPSADCNPCQNEGTCASCLPGSTSVSLDSINVTVGLGSSLFGGSSGYLQVTTNAPGALLPTPAVLSVVVGKGVEVLKSNGAIRQVRATQALADIIATNASGYDINFYTPANFSANMINGLYAPTGQAFKKITLQCPDAPSNFDHLQVIETGMDGDRTSDYYWTPASQEWRLVAGGGLVDETLTSSWDGNNVNRTDVHVLKKTGGATVSKRIERWRVYGYTTNLLQRILDPDGVSLTDSWSYVENVPTNDVRYGLLSQKVQASGYWERYGYEPGGRLAKTISQYLNAPSNAADNACRVTTNIHSATPPSLTSITYLLGQEVGRSYVITNLGEVIAIQCQTPGAPTNAADNLTTVAKRYTGDLFNGFEKSTLRPDGTMTIVSYAVSDGGNVIITTNATGAPNSSMMTITNGTKLVTTKGTFGNVVQESTYDLSGLMIAQSTVTTDEFGRATMVVSLDGTNTTSYDCCGVTSTIDQEGIMTTNAYDVLKRLVTSERAGITTSNAYDAAGHVIARFRNGILILSNAYDVASRLVSTTDPLTNTTSYSEAKNGNGEIVRTTTYPNNSTRIETYYQDGQLKSITGSAVHGVRYEYGVTNAIATGTTNYVVYTKEIRLNTNGVDTAESTVTYTDMLGRLFMRQYADGSYDQFFFNNKGQLRKERNPDGVVVLHAYSDRGDLETTAIDVDQNDVIDYGGTDRITRFQSSVLTAHNTTVLRSTTSAWTTDNQDSAITTAISDLSASGLQSWQISFGLTNSVFTIYDRANAERTITATNADGSYSVALYKNARLGTNTVYDAIGSQLARTTYTYDSHGRLQTATDARTGDATYTHDNADQQTSVTTGYQATSYLYDSMGRQTRVTLPDTGTVTTEYFDTGEAKKTYGVRTYPVEYGYDYAGRIRTMKTWKDFAGNTGTATTTWNYDGKRGFLISKEYPDATSVTYSNFPSGRLFSRKWARNIATTYGYNNAGDLNSISYNDGVTPAVTTVYDRRGRRTVVTNGTDVCTYTYNNAGQVLTESFPQSGATLTNTYDSLLRRWKVEAAGTTVAYGYDKASRLNAVTNGGYTAGYTYLPNSPLVSNLVFKTGGVTKMTTTKNWDSLNRLRKIESVTNGLSFAVFDYEYNAANQRNRRTDTDGSYWDYGYDSLGQVTSGAKKWQDGSFVAGQQYGYDFDEIGNRQSATVNGNVSDYTANDLNQYTQRTVPGCVDILGTAHSNATVTVNDQATTRKGEYFHRQLFVPNSSSAAYTNIWIVGVRKNSGGNTNQPDTVTTETGHEFLPRTPEKFSYDLDGNLLSDGRWTNMLWNAENRLISMETAAMAPSAGAPKQKLEFGYDHQGRRIHKKVYLWDAPSTNYQLQSTVKFIYDGWNLIAELDSTNGLVRSYTWGLDLSGTMQGAGGIGGLLMVTQDTAQPTNHFVAFDGNGNVAALLSADSGTQSAGYEYGPFGETIRATGPLAQVNPFRFSAKYQDVETELLYYGYRYYENGEGRWSSRDPIGEIGGPNVYAFCDNDALSSLDGTGLTAHLHPLNGEVENRSSTATVTVQGDWVLLTFRKKGKPVSYERPFSELDRIALKAYYALKGWTSSETSPSGTHSLGPNKGMSGEWHSGRTDIVDSDFVTGSTKTLFKGWACCEKATLPIKIGVHILWIYDCPKGIDGVYYE